MRRAWPRCMTSRINNKRPVSSIIRQFTQNTVKVCFTLKQWHTIFQGKWFSRKRLSGKVTFWEMSVNRANMLVSINKVKLPYCMSSQVTTGMGDWSQVWVASAPFQYLISFPDQLSLAFPLWVDKMSTSDGTTTAGEKRQVLQSV